MGFRGGGNFRGGGRGGGRGGRGGRGGGRGFDAGPPERVVTLGNYSHPCQGDLVVKVSQKDVPYFNAPVYLENKQSIGKIDEIFGNPMEYFVSVKLSDTVKAKSFDEQQVLYIDPAKLLPIQRFLPGGDKKPGGRGGRGGARGGRGGFGARGGGRGGFGGRGGRGGFGGGGRGGGFGGGGGRGGFGGGRGRGGGGFGRGRGR